MSRTVWNEGYYVRVYELARDGLNDVQIAKALGIPAVTLTKWYQRKPHLAEAVKRARKGKRKRGGRKHATAAVETIQEYIFGRLPEHLQELWERLCKIDRMPNGTAKTEELLARVPTVHRQALFLHAWSTSAYSLSEACRRVNVKPQTVDHWAKTDPDFAELIGRMDEVKKDFFESQFIALCMAGVPSSVNLAVQTKCKDRGYSPKLDISHSGNMTHVHGHIDVSTLDKLPIETRREILAAYREQQAQDEIIIDAEE